jgi:hypothetical protein
MTPRLFTDARLTALAALLLLSGALAEAQSGAPPEFGHGSIPFGDSAQQVLAALGGATVETPGAAAHFIGHYEVLRDFFSEGMEPDVIGLQQQFNVNIVRMYRVSFAGWSNVEAMEFYFFREHDMPEELSSYRLFMVRKTLKTGGSGSHTEVSEGLQEAITGRLGTDPVNYDVKYIALAARISKWTTPDTDIFLLVFQNLFTASDADILYRDREQWQRYVAAHRSEAGEQTRSAGSSF